MGKVAALTGRTRSLDCITDGLKRLGYETTHSPKDEPQEGDVLCLWNRLPTFDKIAKTYEAAGCHVLVFENGWIGGDTKTYALALSQHNGAGTWAVGSKSRWENFGIDLRPWRVSGRHILVVPQRGMGTPPVAMPRSWGRQTLELLQTMTDRPVVYRNPADRGQPIEPLFQDAHAVITWASGAGIKSIVSGVPVFYQMPQWIGSLAAKPFPQSNLESPYTGERSEMLHRLSWALWTKREIASGEAINCVLQSSNRSAEELA